jgi:hypothetical protein
MGILAVLLDQEGWGVSSWCLHVILQRRCVPEEVRNGIGLKKKKGWRVFVATGLLIGMMIGTGQSAVAEHAYV